MPCPVLVQITDLHIITGQQAILHGIDVRSGFLNVLNRIMADENPDYIVITGDIVHDNNPKSYQWVTAEMDKSGIPWSWLPGNHDMPEYMEEKFIRQIHLGQWRLLQINSQVIGQSYGHIDNGELEFITAALQKDPASPTLLCLHHHICDIGHCMDDGRADNGPLFSSLRPFPCVKAILHGHIHQSWDSMEGQIRILGTPSTCAQFLPGAEKFLIDREKTPGYRIFHLNKDGQFTTQVKRVALH